MTRALITVNYGDKLSPNSRASMQAAAARWGVAFFSMEETTLPKIDGLHPAAMKTAAFKVLPYDEIFCLDADTIVSSLCPSPFDTFSGEALRVVRDSSPVDCRIWDWGLHQKKMPNLLGPVPLNTADYWNSGVMLARRAHHEQMFELANRLCYTDFGSGWVDQSPLNMSAIITGVQVEFVDERWNFLAIKRADNWQDMTKSGIYVAHGAGDPDRIHWLHTVKWQ